MWVGGVGAGGARQQGFLNTGWHARNRLHVCLVMHALHAWPGAYKFDNKAAGAPRSTRLYVIYGDFLEIESHLCLDTPPSREDKRKKGKKKEGPRRDSNRGR